MRGFFLDPSGAEIALEFSSVALLGARVELKRGTVALRAIASEALSEGTFSPTLEDPGFVAKEEMRDAVKRVLVKIGATSGTRAALVVPDVVARFRLFTPDEVKSDLRNRDAVIAFRMQKLLPFAPADTRVISAWPRSSTEPVLGIGFSAAVLGAYEQVGQAFGLDVGSVETSSMALLRGLAVDGDALLVRHDPAWLTVTLVRNGWPISIRTLDATVASKREEVRTELASTAVFWRDRLRGDRLAAAFVHASDLRFEALSADLASEFGCVAQRAQPPSRLMVPGLPTAMERSAAPALALLGAG
ncbi:MAG: hypothetical protein JJE39_05570 [Vicinamibacteria bacterium]|nr:hypothetical protein [Vicinamibacteria bacterium]